MSVIAFVILYYSLILAAVIIKFQKFPNYVTTYDWFTNVARIITSTPSTQDALMIIVDEWCLEIGYMNYDYGMGLSEWSLFFVPVKILIVCLLGALITTYYFVASKGKLGGGCSTGPRSISSYSDRFFGGMGATFMALASVSLSWVVCCSTPTWVVGLAMLGLGVSTSLWLEPMGFWVNLSGMFLLVIAIFMAASNKVRMQGLV